MAQIVDVRGSGGDLVIVGGALTLPTSVNPVATVIAGSIRYNTTTASLEIYNGTTWAQATGSNSGVQSFNGRTGGVSLTASDIATALGYTPLGSTTALAYASLPSSLQDIPLVYTSPGFQPPSTQVWTVPVVVPFSLGSNCTGSYAVCGVAPTTSVAFILAYIRATVITTIGQINFLPGQTSGSFSTSPYAAQTGDILTLTTPTIQDASFANIGITVLGTRTT